MLIAALFTIGKTWKQLKYLLMDELIKKMWYLHIIRTLSGLKKDESLDICNNEHEP
jgi:hypothetical protein